MIKRRSLLAQHRLTEREQKNLTLLELIRQRSPLTRTELSQGSGFNIVTISNYLSEFIKAGLVVERGFDVSTGGRKPVLVELNPKAGYAIGIDLGPMHSPAIAMTGLITDLKGAIVHRIVKPRPAMSMDQTLAQAEALLRELIATSPVDARRIRGAAIGIGGVLDERAGTIRDTSQRGSRATYPPLQSRWEDEFRLPVLIGNASTLAGYGEYRLGLERPVENMIYFYSDIGVSLILHGNVYWGSCGSAGEIGVLLPSEDDYLTWVKSPGFVLSKAWDLGIALQARELIQEGHAVAMATMVAQDPTSVTLETVIQSAQAGDQLAKELIESAALQFGIRIAYLVNLLNPDVVVIGGGIEKAGSMLLEPAWRSVKRYAFEESANLVDVLPAQLGDNAVALGAASWIIREVFIQA